MKGSDREKIVERIRERLQHWFDLASPDHRARGMMWYRNARAFAVELSDVYDLPLRRVVGVIAVLSPSVHWESNKRQAEALCRAHADGGPLEAVVLTTYRKQAHKAIKILADKRDDVVLTLGGRAFKTIAFYNNILRPDNHQFVTVDRHMVKAAGFTDFWVNSAAWCYDVIAEALMSIADHTGLVPNQIQAIIWLTYKDLTDSKHPAERAEESEELPI